ncbi:DUF2235 domain-containing protein [Actibacterium sp. 188UL27-1]|uniref:DUF2235 domain-containing protein n=1 Tax=Actibacterium sp. 188UL27-1 TaxID=2786961 RepID=UPI00195E7074|nr:DUF2235 domain-containing protein [Actibacterium sp. 188UL27-1]MBM7068671.1 DUF2235 domain-containing protein [Actibacterium sp. 188UL27-1]
MRVSGRLTARPQRRPRDLIVILDGTMSTLVPGRETNAGMTYQLLTEQGPRADRAVFYEAGVQWEDWRGMGDVMYGRGINRQIERAYGFLSSTYKPGDRIYLFGFSRGAFAVRSLAGVIDKVGLITGPCATHRKVAEAYRHYRCSPDSDAAQAFRRNYCMTDVTIKMIGVWDTVKSLGIRAPVLWRFSQPAHEFHNHHLSSVVEHGYHALALDETRMAFKPELWDAPEGWEGKVEQMWFAGTHGDVGGQIQGYQPARNLANIPLVWMLDKAHGCGLTLPEGWKDRYPTDPLAPSVGLSQGWAKLFLARARRIVGRYPSEQIHPMAMLRDRLRARIPDTVLLPSVTSEDDLDPNAVSPS